MRLGFKMSTKIKVINGHEIWEDEEGEIIKDIKLYENAEEIVGDILK